MSVKPTEPSLDGFGNVRGNNREAVAWYDDHAVYVPIARVGEAAGGTFKEAQVAEVLDRRGLLFKRHSNRRIAVRWVPKIGHIDSYALSRTAFGWGSGADEPEFTVREGSRQ